MKSYIKVQLKNYKTILNTKMYIWLIKIQKTLNEKKIQKSG